MEIKSMSLGPLGTNCYLIYNGSDAIIIDPGGDADVIIDYLNNKSYTPIAILLTHAHFDHIGAVDHLRRTYNIDVYLHGNEKDWLEDPKLNGSILFTPEPISINSAEHELTEGRMQIKSFAFEVLHTPGHSPGSVCFVFKESGIIIGGDVLFNQGVGRTDLPGGNMEQLMESIRTKLYTLDNHMTVYPGHGPETTIGNEKQVNPFIKE
ncbi:MBL fold metallo-hydrolase [Virgibacillus necropolis]|uniref:MBL fold metallo-hydrolase n=1 Tax=Virgibacillus necropolis TaxID=163877 RepID=UPI00384CC6F3